MSGDCESEAHVHPCRVALHRRIEKAPGTGKIDDALERTRDLRLSHTENRAVQVDVLAPGELLVEARSDFEEASDAAAECCLALGRRSDPRQDLEESGLPRAVPPDQADNSPALD